MTDSVASSQSRRFVWQSLLAAVVLGWFLGEPRVDRNTTVVVLFLFTSATFFTLAKSTARRLAWTFALQMFGLTLIPIGGIYVTLPDVMYVFLLFDVYFGQRLRTERFSPVGLAAIGLLLVACVSTASSPVMQQILGSAIRYAIGILLFIGLDRVVLRNDELHLVRVGMALALPVGLIVLYFNGDLSQILLSVESGDRPMYSQALPLVGIMLFPWLILRRTHILTLVLVAGVFGAVTWLGQSRSMIVMMGVTLLIAFATKLGRDLTLLLVAGVVTVTMLLATYSVIEMEGFSDVISVRPESDELRLYKVGVSMENFRRHPIWGMGPGGEGQMSRQQLGSAVASENGLVESLAESGLLGTILFLTIALYPVRQCYILSKRRVLAKDLAGAVLAMLVAVLAPMTFSGGSKSTLGLLTLAIVNKHLVRAVANGHPTA
jgi:O-antigen ligase